MACVIVASLSPDCLKWSGTARSISSVSGLFTPAAASLSACSFRSVPSCPDPFEQGGGLSYSQVVGRSVEPLRVGSARPASVLEVWEGASQHVDCVL